MNEEDYVYTSFFMLATTDPKEPDTVSGHEAILIQDADGKNPRVHCFTCGWAWVGESFTQDATFQHQQDYADRRLKGEKKDDE